VARSAGKSSSETAAKIGTNRGKVVSARRVIDQADEETKQAVMSGSSMGRAR